MLLLLVSWVSSIESVDVPPGHRGLTMPCETCHTTDSWKEMKHPIDFDHTQTGFPLEDRHRNAACETCHVKGDFVTVSRDCQSCHNDVHRAENGSDCQRCHDVRGWIPSQTVDLHQMTRFPLVGVHEMVSCQMCHVNQQQNEFVGLSTECYACHATDFRNARSPNHVAAQIDVRCEQCHAASAPNWENALFDHNQTGFSLVGAHQGADCASCHSNGVFEGTPIDCYSCHQMDFEQTKAPNHVLANLETNCQTCHTDVAWKPSTFDHNLANFALAGAHVTTDCASCHVGGVFTGTPTDCYACHKPDFEQAKEPDHMAANFDSNCQTCHTDAAWKPSTFDHNQTNFALAGAHVETDCASCHVDGVFTGTPTDCYTCHKLDFEKVKDPDHVAANFDQDCLTCHTDVAWEPSTFDHNQTNFVLAGAHVTTDCASCHVDGVFTGTPTDCYTCHKLDFEKVKDPDHVAANFDQDCLTCHTDVAWEPSTFDHSQTDFVLAGAHVTTDCASCHVDGVFSGTPTDCFTCHQLDYEQTQNPNHVLAQLSVQCLDCHTQSAWEPAQFDHNLTEFPLTGRHVNTDCASCHINGQFANTSKDCFACHDSDFQEAKDPNHVAAGFPQDCESCHNTNRWDPADFNHRTYFPIYTGEHRGEWDACSDCHTQATDFKVFSCTTCHEHRKREMDDEHDDVRNYVYQSAACYDCHPNGEE
ncbi:MAG: hypothetical protein HOE48_26040 [Candidatus Latescibacteria bacterium]|nr:hypothetical protein [Candidatus Latescibacterota bacterium]